MDPNFIKNLTPDDPVGYWLECDIDFGKKLHDKRAFNCYPPLPETKVITYRMLSPEAKKLLIDKIGKKAAKNFKSKKLVSTLQNKRKYKVHYLNLQQAMKFGCKLKKVHRVISFKQKKISKNFLNFMTKRRKYSRTKIEERLCKGIWSLPKALKIICKCSWSSEIRKFDIGSLCTLGYYSSSQPFFNIFSVT